MTVTALEIADILIKMSKYTLSPLKIQKLIYLIAGVYLAHYNKSLFNEHFEAWNYGPIIPSVYHKLKINGDRYVRHPIFSEDVTTNEQIDEVISDVYDFYAPSESWKLYNIATTEGSPGANIMYLKRLIFQIMR